MRWWQLANISFAITMNMVAWISTSPVGNQLAKAYDIKLTLVNLLPMLFQIMFIILAPMAMYFIDTKGAHISVLIGSIL